jgi:hypothetical protein
MIFVYYILLIVLAIMSILNILRILIVLIIIIAQIIDILWIILNWFFTVDAIDSLIISTLLRLNLANILLGL